MTDPQTVYIVTANKCYQRLVHYDKAYTTAHFGPVRTNLEDE